MKNTLNRIKLRLLAAGILVTCLFLVPAVTQAQYKWLLNGFVTVSAGEDYFGSNVLKDTSQNASYPYSGWDGKTVSMPNIDICNYVNALLANKSNEDVDYTLDWEVTGTADYTLEIENVSQGRNGSLTGTLSSPEGKPVKKTYQVRLVAPTGYTPKSGDSVTIKFHAKNTFANSAHQRFDRELSAVYTYTVNLSQDYIKNFDAVYSDGAINGFEMQLGTSELPSLEMVYQTVVVWWRTAKVEINPYNYNFLTYSAKEGAYTWGETSTLKISGLGSNKYRPLEFSLKEPTDSGNYIDEINQHIAINTRPENASDDKWLGCYVIGETNSQ